MATKIMHAIITNSINRTPRIRPIENCMGLIVCYIEIARGKVKYVVWLE